MFKTYIWATNAPERELLRNSTQNMRLMAAAALLLGLLTFPVYNVSLADTADSVLKWLFNYLAAEQPNELQDLRFPHGPLAFLQYPLPGTFLFYLALLVQSLLRVLAGFLFLRQRVVYRLQRRSSSIGLLLLFFLLLDFRFTLLFLILMLLEEFRHSRNLLLAGAAALVVAASLYIRAYIGIICLAGFYLPLLFMYSEKARLRPKQKWIAAVLPPLFAALLWLFLFGGLAEFAGYWAGFIQLSLGNSAAVALYPQNVWWLLIPALVLMLIFLFHAVPKTQRYLSFTLALIFLLSFKYALSRQDYGHLQTLIQLTCVSGVFLLSISQRPLRPLLFLMPALLVFYAAFFFSNRIKFYQFTHPDPIAYLGYFFSGNALERLEQSAVPLEQEYQLPEIDFPAGASIDCYPYNYFPALNSGLRISPRPVVQAYAAYTPWLDSKDSAHYRSADAADFLLWHDNSREDFLQLDGQYLLSEEPQALLAMISQYRLLKKEKRQLLYTRRQQALEWKLQSSEAFSAGWEEWIALPPRETEILRLKAHFHTNFKGSLMGLLLKETAVFIEYRFEDGSQRKYRLNPLNARNGIWISPYLSDPFKDCLPAAVDAIRFSSLDASYFKKQLELRWEFVSLPDAPAAASVISWFGQCDSCREMQVWKKNLDKESEIREVKPLSSVKLDLAGDEFPSDGLPCIARVGFEVRHTRGTDAYAYLTSTDRGTNRSMDATNLNRFSASEGRWETHFLELPVDSNLTHLQLQLVNERKEAFEVRNLQFFKIGFTKAQDSTRQCD